MGQVHRCRLWARLGLAATVAVVAGCQERAVKVYVGDAGFAGDAPTTDGPPGSPSDLGFGWGVDIPPPAPPGDDAPACVPLVCDVVGGRYCGKIGDGCGGTLDCGGCPTGQVCGGAGTNRVCAAVDPHCKPLTCDQTGGRYCGKVGDGCGGTLDCGDCSGGLTCGAVTGHV